jgi:ribosomal protein S18 acetylase RimI-like enzyme
MGIPPVETPAVRPATVDDAAAAASLHVEQIGEGFLSLLGPGFLTRLYRRITRTPGSFLLVAEVDGRVVGFVAGSGDVGYLYRSFLLRDGVQAALGAAGRLAAGWRRVLETLRHASGDGVGRGRGTELLAIAVDPAAQGEGIGSALVDAFFAEVDARGDRSAYVVVASHNDRAIRMYGRAGFVPGGTVELHAGTRSLVLQWDRTPDGSDAGTVT